MDFQHSGEIWRDFPELVAGVVFAEQITQDVSVREGVVKFTAIANARLAKSAESELPEIRAWRRAFVHARRWTNRQSALSAVQDSTAAALVVAEAMHDSASSDMPELIAAIVDELNAVLCTTPLTTMLSQRQKRHHRTTHRSGGNGDGGAGVC